MFKLKKTKTHTSNSGKEQSIYALCWGFGSKVLSYFLVLILGNLYLIEEYGQSSYFLAIFNIIMTIILFGIPDSIIPWIIKEKDYKSIINFLYYFGFFGFLILVLFSIQNRFLLPLAFMIPIVLAYNFASSFMRVNEKYGAVNMIRSFFVVVVIVSALILRDLGTMGILLSYVFGNFFVLIFSLFYIGSDIKKLKFTRNINWKTLKEYFVSGITISIVTISFYFLGWIDSIILGSISTMQEVAKYNIASPFANIITLIPLTLSMFLITRISKLKNKNKAEEVHKRVLRVSYFISLISAIALAAISPLLIKIFFPKYIGVEKYIMVLLFGIVFYSIYFIIYSFFVSRLNVKKVFFPIVLAALVNIILDFILVPKFGLMGICIATSIAHLIPLIWLSYKIRFIKTTVIMVFLTIFIPLANLMGYYSLGLLIIVPITLFSLKIIYFEDLKVIYDSFLKILKLS